jgi:hypothetical protein
MRLAENILGLLACGSLVVSGFRYGISETKRFYRYLGYGLAVYGVIALIGIVAEW